MDNETASLIFEVLCDIAQELRTSNQLTKQILQEQQFQARIKKERY